MENQLAVVSKWKYSNSLTKPCPDLSLTHHLEERWYQVPVLLQCILLDVVLARREKNSSFFIVSSEDHLDSFS